MKSIARCIAIAFLLGFGSGLPALALDDQAYEVRITQIDSSAFPKVRLFVSVTDQGGHPISSQHRVALTVLADGQELVSQPLSEGWTVSSILAIDGSGSMAEAIGAARQAAKAYVEQAPPWYEIALLSFSDTPETVQGFTKDKQLLASRIDEITTGGRTALQDTVGAALDLLAGRGGRKNLVLLTDGQENASRFYREEAGRSRLEQRCLAEEVTVSVIGLGKDVDAGYLQTLARGGKYLSAPQAAELKSAFLEQAELLGTEHVLEIDSPSPYADGLQELLEVRLAVGVTEVRKEVAFTSPGVLPHVPGNHGPYAAALAVLFLVPAVASNLKALAKVARFRRRYLLRLGPASPFVGTTEVNSGDKLRVGDLVLLCPHSRTPHYPRSWRLNRCRCMREPGCSGAFCYQKVLPPWLRHMLDRLSAGQMAETGRRWLCNCQGDREGY